MTATDTTPTGTTTGTTAPLSFGQEQLWFLDQLAPGETTYNILLAWRLRGPLRTDLLHRSLTLVVQRHEALRATLDHTDGTPFQRIAPAPEEAELTVVDLTGLDPEAREEEVRAEVARQTELPFDLEAGPLYRFRLLVLGEQDHVLVQGFHHVVTDGWSSAVMNAEITAAYAALLEGREPVFGKDDPGYAAFAAGQRERLDAEELEEELSFWQQKLADLPVLELPTDRPRPQVSNHRGASVIRSLPEGLLGRAHALAQEHGVSLFMVLTAAFNAVLSRYTGQDDIPVGVPMLGRPDPELEDVVGLFINMVVLRSDLSGDPTFAELLERTADTNLELYEHQEVPFQQIVDRVQPVREPGRNPLFQVAVQVLGGATSGDNLFFPGVTSEYVLLPSVSARFDLSLNFIESGDRLQASVEYSAELFDAWRIEAMLGHIETVLSAVTADAGLRLSELPLLTGPEQAELAEISTGEVVPYPQEPLHVQFARTARQQPDAVAVVCRGVELSYAELDRRADLLARHLRGLGVTAGQVVAAVLDRDLDAYVTILGILKSGAAFAMLDPKAPAARLDFMIRDTAAPVVVTRSPLADRLPESSGWATVLVDTHWGEIEAVPADEPLEEWATRESLAYILYTSGSTGQPKGVMIEHRSVSFFCEAYRRTFDFGPADRLLQLPALNFDMSQGEIWTAFAAGATVVAVSPEDAQSPEALTALIREQRATYAGLPPAMLSVLEPEPYEHLRAIMGGAEVLPPDLVNRWNLPGRTFVNLYGPTEAAIACTEYTVDHITWRTSPPIGRPEVNRQVHVVDKDRNLVPKGVAGELLIGGEPGGLARGYLNQPGLSAEKFVADPFDPERTVYRSGDLVRWNADGQLEFLGRIDNQVKLRGLRIELGEIEAALQAHPGVARAVVLMRPDRQGENRLVGYVLAEAGAEAPAVDELREHLRASLPEYMVPTAWVPVTEFPMSSGWKINRKALPDPVEEDGGDGYVEPRTETERQVAEVFAAVLDKERVGAEDGFFAIGGNSLQAMRVVSRINKTFKIKISIRLLYDAVTVAGIAAAVDAKLADKAAGGAAGAR